uniref:uncharacterized protein LOC117610271 n=1 Tax=Osmia lignaria TaxID=473952 RepID=UPI0014790132|nr:uncharacterized protein LOC117610271 [Osmia lignaria]XP_034193357.1 uncharacterized protein LOC117610271 [Osmia lignaria]XP_034193358.1 uncharacterized protein LOC117610271 [Osmia lignaria]XP_034193359.1 uncharacterized protein LOC117610271 [Osmia lignaria]XP_034193360.1 uncharacterized protein LOC117610271 [Osmia lignaria]XP_034193361.1 uncharacterized protein LOC117610271 [Osmia lignaria]XP_034193362.1 uncharacterized protein LOC117610271 [Osmia lignaria]XP_034193363.1 uncharacterized p
MLPQEWLLAFLIAGTATALAPTSHQTMEESLKTALDAITRKQRSLDSQEYYNDLRSFKYHDAEDERKFNRERPEDNNRVLEEEDEEIEFLPSDGGQLETVGNGFQDLNNKLLERALIDYLENIPQQEEPITSSFRERERTSNRKRGSDRLNVDNKELVKLFLEELQDGTSYNLDTGDEGYMDVHQMQYDRYRGDRGNKLYENSAPMSWGELMNKESLFRGQERETDENEFNRDPNLLYSPLAERRNVNGRYPIGRDLETYRGMAKRYPVAKRSPKPMPVKKQVTDPKVAQDLGALFGTQSTTDNQNHTQNYDHDHDHDDQHKHESSSESPKVTPPSKGQKENVTKPNKSKSIEVRKKSVDWSQYFGIDRRRKKASFMAGPETQNQDDEWMLQRYYENMVENLKANDHRDYQKETNDRKDKLEQMNSKQQRQNIKDLIVEDALRYADSEDATNLQKVKDKVMARIAAAYSLEKVRKALNELRNNVAVRIESQKIARSQNNQTSSFRENNNAGKASEKRTSNNIVENDEAFEENRVCPALEIIEKRCRTADSLAGDEAQMLYLPCVMLQICKACVQDDLEEECLSYYDMETVRICNAQEAEEGQKGIVACVRRALILSRLQPPPAVSIHCRINGNESCLRRYHYRYLHRYLRYPYGGQRPNNGYETIGSQQMDR